MSRPSAFSADDRYRREHPPCTQDLAAELSRVTADIHDPVVKLRYLREAMSEDGQPIIQRAPLPVVRRAWYRLRALAALDRVVDVAERSTAVAQRTIEARRHARRTLALSAAAGCLLIPVTIAALASQWLSRPASIAAPPAPDAIVTAPPVQPAPEVNAALEEPPTPTTAEKLPADDLGVTPATIWLADRGPDWELYSNGLRIETVGVVTGTPRRYRIHDRQAGLLEQIQTRPVGILFHSTESDLWPLEAQFEKDLRRSSANLLRYLRQQQAYNYLVDRFGRVYRVVEDESKANHAGRGVWARNEEIYLDLNNAFVGVAFESRWEGGQTLPITRAQLIAARNLTHYLRQRFAIAPEMCVTHGLTSVNPRRGLIGFHRDWARGFPFEAFGLPDLYAQPTPSVALFGFTSDEHFLRTFGERWPGLISAERILAQEARARGLSIAALRAERQALYTKWMQDAPQLKDASHAASVHAVK